MPRLIITADDCGLTAGINQRVYDLHQGGYISAAGVMTNFPAHRHALELFQSCPGLDTGIHLSLTDGHPVTAHETRHPHLLNEDFSFRSNLSLYLRSHFFGAATVNWIRGELEAQLRRFEECGIRPQHMSTHHHFHAIPLLRRLVHDLAEQYGVAWVRGHDFRAAATLPPLLARPQRQSGPAGFTMPAYLTAIQANLSRPVEDFCARIAGLPGTVEIIAHPAPARDPDFPADMRYGPRQRDAETQYLMRAVDRLRQLGIAPGEW